MSHTGEAILYSFVYIWKVLRSDVDFTHHDNDVNIIHMIIYRYISIHFIQLHLILSSSMGNWNFSFLFTGQRAKVQLSVKKKKNLRFHFNNNNNKKNSTQPKPNQTKKPIVFHYGGSSLSWLPKCQSQVLCFPGARSGRWKPDVWVLLFFFWRSVQCRASFA